MKKIQKNRKGFTLVEMVLVIAIIVILAAVVFFTVADYLNAAKGATYFTLAGPAEPRKALFKKNCRKKITASKWFC